jgi:hypothetical protein
MSNFHPEIIAAVVAGIGAIVASITAVIKSLGKKVENLLGELKPNGGTSIKDQVNRLEVQYTRLEKKIDNLYDMFFEFLNKK